MKIKLIAAAALVAILGGCVSGGEMTPAQKDFLRDAAINRIEAFNRAGLQIVELSPLQLLALDTACFTATAVALFNTEEDGTPKVAPESIQRVCDVIMRAAAGDMAPVYATDPDGWVE